VAGEQRLLVARRAVADLPFSPGAYHQPIEAGFVVLPFLGEGPFDDRSESRDRTDRETPSKTYAVSVGRRRYMRLEALPLAVLVVLAGCSGFIGGTPTASPDGVDDEPVRYGIAVQSDYPDEQTFGVRVRDGETTLLNRSKRLAGGERWHVVNLSADDYGDREYELQLLVDGEVRGTSTFSFRESENVERRTGATLLIQGPSSGETHVCGGNVTCYRAAVET
jgi:hypothetical protein